MEKPTTIAVAAAMFCCTVPALGQEAINPSWYLQPHVSAFRPDKDFGTDDRDWGGGVRVGKPLSRSWDLQLSATHARAKQDPFRYRQTLLGADVLLMLSRGHVRPFLLFGVGAQRDQVDHPLRQVRKTSPYASAGLGFQLAFTDQFSMQMDLRTVAGRLRDEELFGFRRSNNHYLNLGLNWAFNQPPAPPPPPPPTPVVQTPPPAQPVPPPPVPVLRFEKVTLSSTELFEFDSATLKLPQPRLDAIVTALSADPTVTDVDITGYADRLGSEKYNLALSERRANAVRNYLVAAGIAGSRLKAYGKGEAHPVVTCNNKRRTDLIKCLEPNRRVEVEQITINKRVP